MIIMKVSETLEKAWALIEDPAHWCTDLLAMDKDGGFVAIDSPKATRWCAFGAVFAVNNCRDFDSPAAQVLNRVAKKHFNMEWASTVNNELGHEAVRTMFKIAIEDAKREEK